MLLLSSRAMNAPPRFGYFLFGLMSLAACAGTEVDVPSSPNIIYILADDLGYGELGSYGQQIIETPHIDTLAQNGMRFTQHYSGSPVCAPSRCVLMTGKHTGHAYIRTRNPIREKATFPIEHPGQPMPP